MLPFIEGTEVGQDMSSMQVDIRAALGRMKGRPLHDGARALLNVLGYRSERTLPMSGEVADFLGQFQSASGAHPLTTREADLISEHWQHARLLMQITDAEIRGELGLRPDSSAFEDGLLRSFVFIAVDLKRGRHIRGDLTTMTRAANKLFGMPAIMIFRSTDRATVAVIHRRQNKRDAERDVLEKVTLIKDISLADPHRAHLDILADISLLSLKKWMEKNNRPLTFDSLHAGWLRKLDAEELNRKFYGDLFAWFEWAKSTVKFPSPLKSPELTQPLVSKEEHIIRMVTRILFVWFIKEKGMVQEDLFNELQAKALLHGQEWNGGDNYYRAILQNLFFATLNTEIKRRDFSSATQTTHRNFNCWRYRDLLADEEQFRALMKDSPFINGGLFDCLDTHESTGKGGYRLDCFTDNREHRQLLRVPNCLFFGAQDGHIGLLDILHKYKFTVEESTPVEQEVALDPELLGSVFENLLASYNPETRQTARKSTGSYYTPRQIVDYMTDESLIAYFERRMSADDSDHEGLQERLRDLLSYEAKHSRAEQREHLIEQDEIPALMQAIAEIRILDPACGSGAFPMGMLQKLTNILNKIDPGNRHWRTLQKERALRDTEQAYNEANKTERDRRTQEISDTFDRYSDGFGRKLFLIQNSIFGVDIQPIACQIAKLRFFITLAIEQEPNKREADNYGIRPLPNLETRFIAADTLIGLSVDVSKQGTFAGENIIALETELALVRERYFNARVRNEKLDLQKEDRNLRKQMAQLLESLGFPHENAERVAAWDLYNPSAPAADWFDPEWMFGVGDGFDIVIGNPPYVRQESIKPKEYKERLLQIYPDATGKSDLYVYFYLRALELLRDGGAHTFICSNSWLDVGYGAPLQHRLLKSTSNISIFHSEVEREFQTADINTIISLVQKGTPTNDSAVRFITFTAPITQAALEPQLRREISRSYTQLLAEGTRDKKYEGDKWGGKYLRAPDIYRTIMEKGAGKFVRLGDVADVRRGITTGANDFFYLDAAAIAHWGIESEFLRPVIKSPRECERILVNPERLVYKIFMCHKEKNELAGTNALAYIEWGESQEFQKRPSCRGRVRWWDLGKWRSPDFLWPDAYSSRFACFENPSKSLADKRFFIIYNTNGGDMLNIYLNSIIIPLLIETEGITNLGEGVIYTNVYWLKKLPVLLDTHNGGEIYSKMKNRKVFSIFEESKQQDRRELDEFFFDILGLTPVERTAVYAATIEMVHKRLDKARRRGISKGIE